MDLSRNNVAGLKAFRETAKYAALKPEERGVLEGFLKLQETGRLDSRTVRDLSRIEDPDFARCDYKGAGTVGEAEAGLITDGIEIKVWTACRPFLFFANPKTGEFYLMRNRDTVNWDERNVEVLEVSTGTWKELTKADAEGLFGTIRKVASKWGEFEEANWDGVIKQDWVVAQFNKDEAEMLRRRDDIELRHGEESLTPKRSGEKYYHEQQKGSLCQMHAANAFLGYGAVKPNALAAFVAMKSVGFGHEHVEGLASGAKGGREMEAQPPQDSIGAGALPTRREVAASEVLDIESGVDLGMVVSYMHQLEEDEGLRVSVKEMKAGTLSFSEADGLVFKDDVTGAFHQVDEAFLRAHSRAMVGTYIPLHARAMRRNEGPDGSWTEVDSFHDGQPVHADLRAHLIATVLEQADAKRTEGKFSLPCAFM